MALREELEEILGPRLPIMVNAVLLPFRGKIIYDGFLPTYNLFFGGGIRRNFEDVYREAKLRFGIITSLPLEAKDEPSDAEKLKFYLRNKHKKDTMRK